MGDNINHGEQTHLSKSMSPNALLLFCAPFLRDRDVLVSVEVELAQPVPSALATAAAVGKICLNLWHRSCTSFRPVTNTRMLPAFN